MRSIYKTIIRPHLEYCTQLWSPVACHGNWANIINLENVQRRFTRLIDGIGTLPYSRRLAELKLTTLAERRLRGDLIETFKMINGIVDYGKSLFNVGRSGSKLVKRHCNSSDKDIQCLYDRFLPIRVLQYWNKLPALVRGCSDVAEFKVKLEVFKCDNLMFGDTGNFWEVSDQVIAKVEGPSYLRNKERQTEYLKQNPGVAKRKGVNIY